jgi:hypothetical protein
MWIKSTNLWFIVLKFMLVELKNNFQQRSPSPTQLPFNHIQ